MNNENRFDLVLPTDYAGVRFRSRLEARWAVFFDALGVRWEYEHECFDLPSGRYLPDFLLPDISSARFGEVHEGCWFEVKPPGAKCDDRHGDLAVASRIPVFVSCGLPKFAGHRIDCHSGFVAYFPDGGSDCYYYFCVCNVCGKIGVEWDGRAERICGHDPSSSDRFPTADDPCMEDAYSAALGFRFGAATRRQSRLANWARIYRDMHVARTSNEPPPTTP